jgi:hypothetical protein
VVDFPDDRDPEYPYVDRPTFSRRPPPAYRLAEPGDTIDRIAIYTSSLAIVFALAGATLGWRRPGLWTSALGLALAAFWHASTPGPTFDGWHGLCWRMIFNRGAPADLRIALGIAACALAALVAGPLLARRGQWNALWHEARTRRVANLLLVAAILCLLRQVELPGVEPAGYWPRWSFVFGLVAFDCALLRAMPPLQQPARSRRLTMRAAGAVGWFALVAGGIWLTWYHRPLERLRTVVPGRIYISAMPTRRGLEIAQRRHRFKTIINLFPEDTPFRSPRLPDELRFAREHGIRYVGSPSDDASSDQFLDLTLNLAQDPAAWPILVHCHGCMDRSPAWMGIYRFVVQRRPLAEIFQEIEHHRGYRPKASVILLYHRVLPPRAPERYAFDKTAALLRRCVHAESSSAGGSGARAKAPANPSPAARVSQAARPRGGRPNLTPERGSLE